jgi:signal transduction histidine kinase
VGDQVRLRQILFSLAGNAIKFTERGEVEVSVRAESQNTEEACLEFAVRDTGSAPPSFSNRQIFS